LSMMMLACVLVAFLCLESVPSLEMTRESRNAPILKRQPIEEDEVIAGFLRNEFYHAEFHRYWDQLEKIVLDPDFLDTDQNALRRALLCRRRGRMWREFPANTQWWEVELKPDDLARVRIFPRSHWRTIAHGSFALVEVVENIRNRARRGLGGDFLAKVRSLSTYLRDESGPPTVILMIGIDEVSPLTIVEGNHRMVAAMLLSPHTACRKFRFICGFSPRMAECCWYKTDISTLWRYTKNTVLYLRKDHAAIEGLIFRIQQDQVHE